MKQPQDVIQSDEVTSDDTDHAVIALVKHLKEAEIVRFLMVGVTNTILGFIYYNILLVVFAYQLALSVAYIFGIITSYFLNSFFVFRKAPTFKGLFQFPAVYIVQYIVNLVVVSIAVEWFQIDERIAFLFGVILTIPITFLMSRFIIKRANKATETDGE